MRYLDRGHHDIILHPQLKIGELCLYLRLLVVGYERIGTAHTSHRDVAGLMRDGGLAGS